MLVVVDTNILVSSLFAKAGNEAQIVQLIATRRITLLVSSPIFREYEEVLGRRKFHFALTSGQSLLRIVLDFGLWVDPGVRLSVSSDESDNRFLECALAGDAEFLITGNSKHFPAAYGHTRVMNAAEFLRIWTRQQTKQLS